jgi:voltage-gated potassium channel Kch
MSGKNNWIFVYGLDDMSIQAQYITSMYFCLSTLLTVGYGDIVPQSIEEKLFSMLLMILGILSFSFATGSLSSIIQSYDQKEAALKEKITTLNQI